MVVGFQGEGRKEGRGFCCIAYRVFKYLRATAISKFQNFVKGKERMSEVCLRVRQLSHRSIFDTLLGVMDWD